MKASRAQPALLFLGAALAWPGPGRADVVLYNNDFATDSIAMASTPSFGPITERETGDDFILGTPQLITGATFTGLVAPGATVDGVVVEIYRVFPKDSTDPPSGRVPTRVNSPSDVAFASRDSAVGELTFTTNLLSSSFTAANSVINGINPVPNQTTGGEGPVTGQEVQFAVTLTTPILLPADHYFFVPQVLLGNSNLPFLWLSAPRPATVTPISPDLQAWIRSESLAPDWLRVGTDVIGGQPAPTFNAAFSIQGLAVPGPSALILAVVGAVTALGRARYGRSRAKPS